MSNFRLEMLHYKLLKNILFKRGILIRKVLNFLCRAIRLSDILDAKFSRNKTSCGKMWHTRNFWDALNSVQSPGLLHQQPGESYRGQDRQWVHYGKFRATRRTFVLRSSKLSSFVEILGLNVDVERGFHILKHVSHLFTIKEGFLSHWEKL